MMQGTATLWVHRQYIFSRLNCSIGAANAHPGSPPHANLIYKAADW